MTSPADNRFTRGQTLTVSPAALDDVGAGLCDMDVATVHVAGALPGEQVVAEVEHRSPHRGRDGRLQVWARLQQVLEPSPDRVAPVCPGYGACGGCPLQHLAYPAQLTWKRERVRAALARVPALAAVPPVEACVPSPRPFGYRNQGKYVYGRLPDGSLALGAFAPRSHRLVDLRGCRLVEPVLDETVRALLPLLEAQAVAPFDEVRRTGVLRYVVLRANARAEVLVALVSGRAGWPQAGEIARALMTAVPAVVGVALQVNDGPGNVIFGPAALQPLAGRDSLLEVIAGVPVEVPPQAFLQVNREVAALAYTSIVEASAHTPPRRVLDVYAGVGGISFALHAAHPAAEIVAVEENPHATSSGARAAKDMASSTRRSIADIKFVAGSAESAVPLLPGTDLVVLNPPRAGVAPGLLAALAEQGRLSRQPGALRARLARPAQVIYLSCNPDSLARDLAVLDGGGLHIARLIPFDMHPHTPHVETLAVLR